MESHGVLPCDDRWRSIVADYAQVGSYGKKIPGNLRLLSSIDATKHTYILQCILSHEEFRMDELPAVVRQEGAEIVLFALRDVGVEA